MGPQAMARHAPGGLERSCTEGEDWARIAPAGAGIELMEAQFAGHAFDRHRHDVYAIGLTLHGVQEFACRGAMRASTAGRVLVIHPDEPHDGHAGTEAGFGYRMVYMAPELVRQALAPDTPALPFVGAVTLDDPFLARAINGAFAQFPDALDGLAADQLALDLAEGLRRHDRTLRRTRTDAAASGVDRVRDFLDANPHRMVGSAALEQVSGLDRFALARQFRAHCGTSPYRYLTMRRLEAAKRMIVAGEPLAAVAAASGFADQAHLTRQFKAAYGVPPGRFLKLVRR
ncbi:MAG: AraC family transcriptional regulator [Alphaproteobacteria bacterium]|nr:AraC family transcriptional regulator [Alphaproteobacteria bacterium]